MHSLLVLLAGIAIGAIPTAAITAAYCIGSGYGPGWRKAADVVEEVRQVRGEEIRLGGIRRRGRDLVEVERAADEFRAGS